MKILSSILIILFGGLGAFAQGVKPARPNIVVILADDLGFSDIGAFGGEISTPNLDRLARGGMRFTQFYNNTRCSPSRASLLTGLYNHQTGVGEVTTAPAERMPPGYLRHMNDRCVTIAEVLRANGYHTLMSGKWHLGKEREHWPVRRGFERSYTLIDSSSNYFGRESHHDPNGKSVQLWAIDDREHVPPAENFYTTDAFGDAAVNFIEEYGRRDQPFFLYLAFTAPHWPLHALAEDVRKYQGKYSRGWEHLRAERHRRQLELGILDPRWRLSPSDSLAPRWETLSAEEKATQNLKMAVYAAMIERLDRNVGKVIEKLKETGAEKNTLVLFLSDNGNTAERPNRGRPGAAVGERGSYFGLGLPWANASNTPFRLYKHWVHEGGISTPFIAYYPKMIKPDSFYRQPAHLIDIMRTSLDLAGAAYPKTFEGREIIPLAGKSLVPALRGATEPIHTELYWEHQGNRAVRQGKWKLVQWNPNEWELYDMEADRTELNNLAAKHPQKVAEMRRLYEDWARRSGVAPWTFAPYKLQL